MHVCVCAFYNQDERRTFAFPANLPMHCLPNTGAGAELVILAGGFLSLVDNPERVHTL